MQQQLTTRLDSLRAEFARGQAHLKQLEEDADQTRQTMLRISGAIQVLEELLKEIHEATEASDPDQLTPNGQPMTKPGA
jgi:predicted nuclease with TOPRIM domain